MEDLARRRLPALRPLAVGGPRRPAPDLRRWCLGLLVTMLVSVPALAVEEDWHGRAMIDLGGLLWVPFALAVAAAFLAGGAISATARRGRGRRRPRPAMALVLGASCGLTAIGLLVGCDLLRRFAVAHVGLSFGVVELWVVAGAGAVVLSGLAAGLASALAAAREPRLVRVGPC